MARERERERTSAKSSIKVANEMREAALAKLLKSKFDEDKEHSAKKSHIHHTHEG